MAAVGPDELPVKLLKFGLNHDLTMLRVFHWVIKLVWHQREYRSGGKMP